MKHWNPKILGSQVALHPSWVARLSELGGRGTEICLELIWLLFCCRRKSWGFTRPSYRSEGVEPIGAKVVLGGFGNLVDGVSGSQGVLNRRRVGGSISSIGSSFR